MPQQWNRYSFVANNPLKYVDPTGELLELTGSEEERKAAYEHIKGLVGKEGAKLLFIREEKGHFYVDYKGKMGQGDKLAGTSELNASIARIIESDKTLEYRIATNFETKEGRRSTAGYSGAATVGAEESLTGNTQIFVNPKAASIATSILYGTFRGAAVSSDGKGLIEYDDTVDAHEFGHAYANMFGNASLKDGTGGKSNPTAIRFENYVRERRGLNKRTGH